MTIIYGAMKQIFFSTILIMFIVAPCSAKVHAAPVSDNNQVRMDIFDWVKAWESKDIDRYMAHYHPAFRADGENYHQWRKRKNALFKRPGPISVKISQVWIAMDQKTAVARFFQEYKDAYSSDIGEKTLELEKWDGQWKIISETWTAIQGTISQLPPSDSLTATKENRLSVPKKQDTPATPSHPKTTGVAIKDIQFRLSPVEESVIIEMEPYTVPAVFSLDGDSPRVVIDIRGVHDWIGKSAKPIEGRFIKRIRTHLHPKLRKLRIVLDLHPPGNYKISRVAHPRARKYMLSISPEE